MKKEIVLFASVFMFLSIILSSNVLSANFCSSPDQIIFKLSDTTNAHAETFNRGTYNTEICYNQLFSNAPTPALRECNNNVVLRLSDTTNAHAEDPNGNTAGYFNICYRDLRCTLKSSCSSNEVQVVKLSDVTNAHLETTLSNYNQYLCCTSRSASGEGCNPACEEGKICSEGQCVNPPQSPQCGNGNIDSGEGCDGNNFGGKTCPILVPGSTGALSCNQCIVNTGACITGENPNPQCSDGLDNDNDEKIDFGNDPGCSNDADNDETDTPIPFTEKAYWADNNEAELANRAEVNLGARITLIAEGVPSASQVTFTILDNDGLLGRQEIREFRNIASSGTIAKISWTPSLADFNNGQNALEGNELELYLQATVPGQYNEQWIVLILTNAVIEPTDEGCVAYNEEDYIDTLNAALNRQSACNQDIGNQIAKDSAYSSANSELQNQFGVGCNKETINSQGRTVITTCECKWQSNECKFSYSHRTLPIGSSSTDPNICAPKCEYSYDEEACDGEFQTLILSRDLGDLNNCSPDEIDDAEANCPEQDPVEVDCRSSSLTLPFFNSISILLTLSSVIVIYLILNLKRKLSNKLEFLK